MVKTRLGISPYQGIIDYVTIIIKSARQSFNNQQHCFAGLLLLFLFLFFFIKLLQK